MFNSHLNIDIHQPSMKDTYYIEMTHKHVSNEPEAYFVAHLAPKTREKHSLTYRPFNFLKHPPSAS